MCIPFPSASTYVSALHSKLVGRTLNVVRLLHRLLFLRKGSEDVCLHLNLVELLVREGALLQDRSQSIVIRDEYRAAT